MTKQNKILQVPVVRNTSVSPRVNAKHTKYTNYNTSEKLDDDNLAPCNCIYSYLNKKEMRGDGDDNGISYNKAKEKQIKRKNNGSDSPTKKRITFDTDDSEDNYGAKKNPRTYDSKTTYTGSNGTMDKLRDKLSRLYHICEQNKLQNNGSAVKSDTNCCKYVCDIQLKHQAESIQKLKEQLALLLESNKVKVSSKKISTATSNDAYSDIIKKKNKGTANGTRQTGNNKDNMNEIPQLENTDENMQEKLNAMVEKLKHKEIYMDLAKQGSQKCLSEMNSLYQKLCKRRFTKNPDGSGFTPCEPCQPRFLDNLLEMVLGCKYEPCDQEECEGTKKVKPVLDVKLNSEDLSLLNTEEFIKKMESISKKTAKGQCVCKKLGRPRKACPCERCRKRKGTQTNPRAALCRFLGKYRTLPARPAQKEGHLLLRRSSDGVFAVKPNNETDILNEELFNENPPKDMATLNREDSLREYLKAEFEDTKKKEKISKRKLIEDMKKRQEEQERNDSGDKVRDRANLKMLAMQKQLEMKTQEDDLKRMKEKIKRSQMDLDRENKQRKLKDTSEKSKKYDDKLTSNNKRNRNNRISEDFTPQPVSLTNKLQRLSNREIDLQSIRQGSEKIKQGMCSIYHRLFKRRITKNADGTGIQPCESCQPRFLDNLLEMVLGCKYDSCDQEECDGTKTEDPVIDVRLTKDHRLVNSQEVMHKIRELQKEGKYKNISRAPVRLPTASCPCHRCHKMKHTQTGPRTFLCRFLDRYRSLPVHRRPRQIDLQLRKGTNGIYAVKTGGDDILNEALFDQKRKIDVGTINKEESSKMYQRRKLEEAEKYNKKKKDMELAKRKKKQTDSEKEKQSEQKIIKIKNREKEKVKALERNLRLEKEKDEKAQDDMRRKMEDERKQFERQYEREEKQRKLKESGKREVELEKMRQKEMKIKYEKRMRHEKQREIINRRMQVEEERIKAEKEFQRDKKIKEKEKKEAKMKQDEIEKKEIEMLEEEIRQGEGDGNGNILVDLIGGILKLVVNIVMFILKILFNLVRKPLKSLSYIHNKIFRDPEGTYEDLKRWFRKKVAITKMRILHSCNRSPCMHVILDQVKNTDLYISIASRGKSPAEVHQLEMEVNKRRARIRRRRHDALYSCRHVLLTTLRRAPCLWIYFISPNLYPHFLSFLEFLKQFCKIVMFCLALICWTPGILAFEICKAAFCCSVCTG